MNKKELIDFYWYIQENEIDTNIPQRIEKHVDAYLKSLDSDALLESQIISENENHKKILKYLTQTSSKKAGERLAFYVKYIQPIKEYFKID